jgi:hypothetical protein
VTFKKFYYANVPDLGNVAVSRHAQQQAEADGVTEEVFQRVLERGKDRPDGLGIVWREELGVRLVILLHPEPYCGAALVKTIYRVQRQAMARK